MRGADAGVVFCPQGVAMPRPEDPPQMTETDRRVTRPREVQPDSGEVPATTSVGRPRIAALDVLRGFALCGVLIANVRPIVNADPAFTPQVSAAASAAYPWLHLLVDQRFLPVFSVLFGARRLVCRWPSPDCCWPACTCAACSCCSRLRPDPPCRPPSRRWDGWRHQRPRRHGRRAGGWATGRWAPGSVVGCDVLELAGAVLLAQCVWSTLLLRRYRYEPVEWLWRCVTWGRQGPNRSITAPSRGLNR